MVIWAGGNFRGFGGFDTFVALVALDALEPIRIGMPAPENKRNSRVPPLGRFRTGAPLRTLVALAVFFFAVLLETVFLVSFFFA